jgi:hypothetical protein
MRPRNPKFWEIKMRAIITVGTHTELHKSSPSPHPAAQVQILYYFPPSVCVLSSCFLSWKFTIKHFSDLHTFRFCYLCYIKYSVFIHCQCSWRMQLLTFTITQFSQFCYCQTSLPWPRYNNYCRFLLECPLSICGVGCRSFLGWNANVTMICDVTMVFYSMQTISFTKLI